MHKPPLFHNLTTKGRTKTMKSILMAVILAAALASYGESTAPQLLKDFEGFRSSVYKCDAGKATIGYGFTSKELIAKGHMTEAEATAELKKICEGIAVKLRKVIGTAKPLTASQEAAVVSFIYNVGWTNFKTSTMCRLLKEGRRGAAIGVEFRKWVYVNKGGKRVVSKRLAKRREKELRTFLIG